MGLFVLGNLGDHPPLSGLTIVDRRVLDIIKEGTAGIKDLEKDIGQIPKKENEITECGWVYHSMHIICISIYWLYDYNK